MSKKKIVFMKDFVESDWGKRPPVLKADGVRLRSAAASAPDLSPEQEYKKCYNILMSDMLQLLKLNIDRSIFGEKSPKHIDEYTNQLIKVHTAALNFTVDILPEVKNLTEKENKQLDLLNMQFAKSVEYVDRIIEDPTSEFVKQKLRIEIEDAQNYVETILSYTKGLIKDLKAGATDISTQSEALNCISQLMLQDKDVDEAIISQIRKDIKIVEQDIATQKALIVGYSVAIGASVVFTTVTFFINAVIGGILLFFTLPVVGISAYQIYSTYQKIEELKAKIKEKEKEISKYEIAILALIKTADEYSSLKDKTSALQGCLSVIVNEWNKINDGLNEMSEELNKSADWDTQTWTEVKQELLAAQEKTQLLCEELSKITIEKGKTMVTKESVETGLTQEKFQAFVDNAEKVTIEEYLKSKVA